jgi:hypothetical protein
VKWEYKRKWWNTLDGAYDREINKLGHEGWELVSVTQADDTKTLKIGFTHLFKRPVGGWRCPTCQAMHDAVEALA